ncbi:MAG: hypothetical protein R3C68_05615 [Myxococcota bacterium]
MTQTTPSASPERSELFATPEPPLEEIVPPPPPPPLHAGKQVPVPPGMVAITNASFEMGSHPNDLARLW